MEKGTEGRRMAENWSGGMRSIEKKGLIELHVFSYHRNC